MLTYQINTIASAPEKSRPVLEQLRTGFWPYSQSRRCNFKFTEVRHERGKSQLELSLDTGISQRHLSFVESGRSAPSRKLPGSHAFRLDMLQPRHYSDRVTPMNTRPSLNRSSSYSSLVGSIPSSCFCCCL
jgi:DNA-binding XRE family transcriptional regulator